MGENVHQQEHADGENFLLYSVGSTSYYSCSSSYSARATVTVQSQLALIYAPGCGYTQIFMGVFMYRILPKISPLPSLTSKFLHRYFYLIYKPPPPHCKKCTVSKNERLAIDKNAVIRSLNGLTS